MAITRNITRLNSDLSFFICKIVLRVLSFCELSQDLTPQIYPTNSKRHVDYLTIIVYYLEHFANLILSNKIIKLKMRVMNIHQIKTYIYFQDFGSKRRDE